jgi:hypothetical protein
MFISVELICEDDSGHWQASPHRQQHSIPVAHDKG